MKIPVPSRIRDAVVEPVTRASALSILAFLLAAVALLIAVHHGR